MRSRVEITGINTSNLKVLSNEEMNNLFFKLSASKLDNALAITPAKIIGNPTLKSTNLFFIKFVSNDIKKLPDNYRIKIETDLKNGKKLCWGYC